MPELGEIRHAGDIGKKGGGYWKWWECSQCYKQEWKRTTKTANTLRPDSVMCRPCNIAVQKRTFMLNIHSYTRKTV